MRERYLSDTMNTLDTPRTTVTTAAVSLIARAKSTHRAEKTNIVAALSAVVEGTAYDVRALRQLPPSAVEDLLVLFHELYGRGCGEGNFAEESAAIAHAMMAAELV